MPRPSAEVQQPVQHLRAVASASASARWVGFTRVRKYWASVCSLTFGTSGQTTRRASFAVQTGGPGSGG